MFVVASPFWLAEVLSELVRGVSLAWKISRLTPPGELTPVETTMRGQLREPIATNDDDRDRALRWPRRSNSRSSSSSTRLLSNGESGPPFGVPSTLGLTSPFSITPAFKNARMSFSSRWSATRFAIWLINLS